MIEPSDVRDLEQEGVLGNINLSQSWSAGVQDAFINVRRDLLIHDLRGRVERLEEDMAVLRDILIQGLTVRVEILEEILADRLKERKNQKGEK